MQKAFERILIVMFENQYRTYVMQNPFMRKLAAAGACMTNFFGAFHPSQTNYLASLAGEICAVTNDTPPASPLMQETLVDVLEEAGVSWKAYMESYPGDPWKPIWKQPGYPAADQPLTEYPRLPQLANYYRKHNAFGSFHSIQQSETRWEKIVDEVQFWRDLESLSLPEYSWFTPNIWNDGHYLHGTHIDTDPRTQLVPQMATWLEYVFLPNVDPKSVSGGTTAGQKKIGLGIDLDLLLADPSRAWKESRVPAGTLIVITFDEADYDATDYDTNYDGPNQIYTVLLGDMIKPGTVIDSPFNHYSLMKSVEKNFGTRSLEKNDRDAAWFRFLWGESFQWSAVGTTSQKTSGSIALAASTRHATLFYNSESGPLICSDFDGQQWSPGSELPFETGNQLATAVLDGHTHLVYADPNGNLNTATRCPNGLWTSEQALNQRTCGSIAMTAYRDDADKGRRKLMLCWQSESGFIRYIQFTNGHWNTRSSSVGQLTDGPMSLGQMGPSLYLVYKERNSRGMRITSYNLARYNAFEATAFDGTAAPQNNTSLHAWSPADWPVGSFAKKMAALQNDYQAEGHLALATIAGEMHLFHRGAYDDMPSGYTEKFGLTGVFTASDQQTNGFGTLDQAGWTRELQLPWMQLDPECGIAAAAMGERLIVVWQAAAATGDEALFAIGEYKTLS